MEGTVTADRTFTAATGTPHQHRRTPTGCAVDTPCSPEAVLHLCCLLRCSTYNLTELVCMGGFNNTRQEVSWEGFTLELDETKYPWGTLYELEAETVSDLC